MPFVETAAGQPNFIFLNSSLLKMSLQKQAIIAMSIETATRSGSLALLHDQNVCAQWEGGETTSHSSELLVEIEKLLSQTEFNLGDLDLLAGAIGPGSFTGLRVGLATLKGLATALQKPVCGVPTLEAMAFGHPGENTKITVLSAGRNEVYAQIWKLNKKNELVAETALKTIDLTSLLSKLDSNQVLDWIITKENY